MKKLISLLLTAAMIFIVTAALSEKSCRKLTVMVYMCGSNLETYHGSASKDLKEMMAAETGEDVSVLAMVGGSEFWDLDYDTEYTHIVEISGGKQETVCRYEKMNMGEAKTLTALVDWALENRPAEEYALILWDHGGGPLEGLCRDELFYPDYLTMEELTEALEPFLWDEELKWIGFDACLMSTVEVASALAPYTRYMIASEETEPASGWNYAFLNGIENDADGAATGRRIIDSYFESLEGSKDTLTMACVDLSRIGDVGARMDSFFRPIAETMNPESFRQLSGLRLSAVSFGKGMRDLGANGYDLVDLMDLVEHYQEGEADAGVREALDQAVVYSRSNEENACGLSVYHPYLNKDKYLSQWKTDYLRQSFSSGYLRYVERFGAFLTGDSTVDWAHLKTGYHGHDENEVHHFSLQLTPEQQEEFLYAQLVILQDPWGKIEPDAEGHPANEGGSLKLVDMEEARITEDGTLIAEYSGRTLYVMNENNEVIAGPVDYFLGTGGDNRIYTLTQYYDKRGLLESGKIEGHVDVLYGCEVDTETGDVKIVQARVYDPITDSYTNRVEFSEDRYTSLWFHDLLRYVPQTDRTIPDFSRWELWRGYYAHSIVLPAKWHFRMGDYCQPEKLYAMFRITDTRQNTVSSIPVRISNPDEQKCVLMPDTFETEQFSARISAEVHNTNFEPYLEFEIEFTNKTEKKIDATISRIVLNENRTYQTVYSGGISLFLQPKEKTIRKETVKAYNLTDLNEITQIDAVLDVRVLETKETESYPVSIAVRNCDVSAFAPRDYPVLAEYDGNGLLWELLSLEQSKDGYLRGLIRVQNQTEEIRSLSYEPAFNDFLPGTSYDFNSKLTVEIQPQTCTYLSLQNENWKTVSSTIAGQYAVMSRTADHLLESQGIQKIETMTLYTETDTVVFALSDPVVLSGARMETIKPVTILEGDVSIALEGILITDNEIALLLLCRNDTDQKVNLRMSNAEINGQTAPDTYFLADMPPFTRGATFVKLKTPDLDTADGGTKKLRLSFRNSLAHPTGTAEIVFSKDIVPESTENRWVETDHTQISPTRWDKTPLLLSEKIIVPEQQTETVLLKTPLTEDEAGKVNKAEAKVCFLLESEEGFTAQEIVSLTLEKGQDGQYEANYSGLAAMIDNTLIRTTETQYERGNTYIYLEKLYLYDNKKDYDPAEATQSLSLPRGFSQHVNISTYMDISSGYSQLVKHRTIVYDDRNNTYAVNCLVTAAAILATERPTIVFRLNEDKTYTITNHKEVITLPVKDTLQPVLVPVSELREGRLCAVYDIQFNDGTKKKTIVEWETGEILYDMIILK